jgi:mono/diheme cytochrome c family protein
LKKRTKKLFAALRERDGDNGIRMITKSMVGLMLLLGASMNAHAESAGEYVARASDCVACHSVPGGRAFAGGLKMGSPLGAIYATNITPDPDTGIGNYTLQDFDNAVRHGVARDGHHLYPAMPYPSYAKLTDTDIKALYDFYMKEVPPVQQANKPPEIPGYLAFRWPLAIWNSVFADTAPFAPNPAHDAVWNRGAYLVEGPGHCGACHTPRGISFAEKASTDAGDSFLAGAPLDGWSAPNLRGDLRTGVGAWSEADLEAFLKTGHNADGAAFGSMVDVVNNSTPYLNDADIHAVAVYLKSLTPTVTQAAYTYTPATAVNAIYAGNCASCHGADGKGFASYLPRLAGNPTVLDPDPSSLINITLNGSMPLVVKGAPDAYRMPQFRLQLTDQQIAEVLSYVRASWGNGSPSVTASQVATLRKSTDPSSDQVTVLKMR